MPIIVGYTPTAEGDAALDHAVEEAKVHGDSLLVINVSASREPSESTFASDEAIAALEQRLKETGVEATIRQLVRGKEPAEEIVSLARENSARFIVIGLRRRSPVGKLLLGSNSQEILLDADCPVIAVKAVR